MVYVTFLLILLGAVGGTVTHEANAAMPGDLLYPYKISVNEEVEKFVANTAESRARWDLYTLNERLDEAKALALHNKLDAKAQTDVTDAVSMHVRNLTDAIEAFQQSNNMQEAATVASDLYTTLKQHEQTIRDTGSLGSTDLQVSLAPVLVRLRTSLAAVALISTKVQAKASIKTPVAVATITGNPSTKPLPKTSPYFR